jgi:hypothetical protein
LMEVWSSESRNLAPPGVQKFWAELEAMRGC